MQNVDTVIKYCVKPTYSRESREEEQKKVEVQVKSQKNIYSDSQKGLRGKTDGSSLENVDLHKHFTLSSCALFVHLIGAFCAGLFEEVGEVRAARLLDGVQPLAHLNGLVLVEVQRLYNEPRWPKTRANTHMRTACTFLPEHVIGEF